jgi:predicted O-methyltransferase YrrM
MFEAISPAMLARMRELEAIDRRDRSDGTPRSKRLRQIPPEVGKFLALLAASAPAGPCLEIGTSAGYSTLWLALAARASSRSGPASATGGPSVGPYPSLSGSRVPATASPSASGHRVTTFENDAAKVELARATFAAAGVADLIDLIPGDARTHLPNFQDIGFCFLDADKDTYAPCYELVLPRMLPGAILVADNAISHAADLRPMLDRALSDPRVDAVIVPIGNGDLVCRKK